MHLSGLRRSALKLLAVGVYILATKWVPDVSHGSQMMKSRDAGAVFPLPRGSNFSNGSVCTRSNLFYLDLLYRTCKFARHRLTWKINSNNLHCSLQTWKDLVLGNPRLWWAKCVCIPSGGPPADPSCEVIRRSRAHCAASDLRDSRHSLTTVSRGQSSPPFFFHRRMGLAVEVW